MTIRVSNKPSYAILNGSHIESIVLSDSDSVEIIENDNIGSIRDRNHYPHIDLYNIPDQHSAKFKFGKIIKSEDSHGHTTYKVYIKEDNETIEINSGEDKYYFKVEIIKKSEESKKSKKSKRNGGKRKTHHNKKSIIKTKTVRKRV